MGQEIQFVAEPASLGFLDFRKCIRLPEDVINDGSCGFAVRFFEDGEHSIHMIKSMSWQHFVKRIGAVVSCRLQFPLFHDQHSLNDFHDKTYRTKL
jgi:hypothetical protein